jgi:3-methyladenine DNA glycosylase AlkD
MTGVKAVVAELRSLADPTRKPGMARVGIDVRSVLGVSIPRLRALAKKLGRDHDLALALWNTGIHEARILASMVDDPRAVTRVQMESWVGDFNSWDVCDQVCGNLFGSTPFAYTAARAWVRRPEEFVKRAGFTLIAERAVHDKEAADLVFERFLPMIRRGATDQRNYVKKAVNWALRQIGKRNLALNGAAIAEAEALLSLDSPSARWIARDALRELRSPAVQERLRARGSR